MIEPQQQMLEPAISPGYETNVEREKRAQEERERNIKELHRMGDFYPDNMRCVFLMPMWRCDVNFGQIGQKREVAVLPSFVGNARITTVSGREALTGPMMIEAADGFRLKCNAEEAVDKKHVIQCTTVPSISIPENAPSTSVGSPKRGRDKASGIVLGFSGKDVVQCYGASDKKFTCFVNKGSEDVQSGKKRYDMVSCGGSCSSISAFSKAGPGTLFTTSVPGSTGKCSEVVKDGKDVLACMVSRG